MTDEPTAAGATRKRGWVRPSALALLALAAFGFRLDAEPEFPDEWAYVSQAYFAGLLAEPDDPRWLEYPAFDLPPLPKYTIGLALKLGGYDPPGAAAARRWYAESIKTRFGDRAMLVAARWPSVIFGVLGCLAIYAIGTMALDRRAGVLASLLLMLDPLYRMLARRAMSDVQQEGLVLASLAVGLWAWRSVLDGRRAARVGLPGFLGAGVLGGLAVLAKLTGGLALMVLASWAALGLVLARFSWRSRLTVLAATGGAGAIAFATFVALNPFVWSDPAPPLPPPIGEIAARGVTGRTALVIEHRASVSDQARRQFPRDALDSFAEKVGAVAVQGFGRFGPLGRKRLVEDIYDPNRSVRGFDSTIRHDRFQDSGAWLWLPLVLSGGVWAFAAGRAQYRSGEAPTAWALLAQAAVTFATIAAYIPLAWDRYFLPLQAPACLLAAGALARAADALARAFRRDGRGP